MLRYSESAAPKTIRETERELILQTLNTVHGVLGGVNGAAAKLGLKRTTLIHRMKKLGIERPKQDIDDERKLDPDDGRSEPELVD
jgi:formate hydrogenlyase transcriptional activator